MKIVCTLKEFESLIARCPMYNYLLSSEETEKYLNKCIESCVLFGMCKADSEKNWSFSNLVEIVSNDN